MFNSYSMYTGHVRVYVGTLDMGRVIHSLETLAWWIKTKDPFWQPEDSYFWEDGRIGLLPSAEQYAIRKRENAPSD